MDIPIDYTFDLSSDGSFKVPANLKIIFLCGVLFGRGDNKDKRTVLKSYLEKTTKHHPIILEEHFTVKSYERIGVRNLHDIETLVGCFSDAVIIIHESISTGAELGMLASNKSIASKLLILHPDVDSVEERKISSFIDLAFYGDNPVLSKESAILFHPSLVKNYETNDRYVYHTSFPNNLSIASRTTDSIDAFLDQPEIQPMSKIKFKELTFDKPSTYKPHIVDFYKDKDTVNVYISPMAMRALLLSVLSLDFIRSRLTASTSMSTLLTTFESEFEKIVLATIKFKTGVNFNNIKISIKGIELSTYQDRSTTDYRKTIGLFIYLLKAMGYIVDDKGLKFKFTKKFSTVRDDFKKTIIAAKKTTFAKHLERSR
jgi:hypothetical protein